MTSVGDKLRQERVRLGIELADLAGYTKISSRYLEAIEAGDKSKVPGWFFYRSFVLQYATALGMNTQELENDLERVREAEAPIQTAEEGRYSAPKERFPLKTPNAIVMASNRGNASGRTGAYVLLLVGVSAGCCGLYAVWHHMEANSVSAAVSEASRNEEKTKAAQWSAPNPGDKVVLTVAAREATWLSLSSDGKPVFSGVLEPSQTKIMGGKTNAMLRVSNAAGLDVTWNGKRIGPIGERGQAKTVVFTPENFQILSAAGSL